MADLGYILGTGSAQVSRGAVLPSHLLFQFHVAHSPAAACNQFPYVDIQDRLWHENLEAFTSKIIAAELDYALQPWTAPLGSTPAVSRSRRSSACTASTAP